MKNTLFKNKPIGLLLRFAVFFTFLGHGIVAYNVNPTWISLITAFGFSEAQSIYIMPYIGMLDILVAVVLLFYPLRIVLIWAVFWAFITALSRPISGLPIVDFIERASNWTIPLVLLLIYGFPKNLKDLFYIENTLSK